MPSQPISQCCLCSRQFLQSNQPRIMPSCDHSVCTNCLKNAIKNQLKLITCTYCHNQQEIQDIDLQTFPKNITLIKALKQKTFKNTSTVTQTMDPICKNKVSNFPLISSAASLQSSQSSQLLRTDSSLLTRKSSISQQLQLQKICQIHQKQMQIICLSDFTRLCALCAVFGAHKDHQLKTVNQTSQILTQTVGQFDQIKRKKKLLETRIKNTEFKSQIVQKISTTKNKLSNQIKDHFKDLKQAINQAQKNAIDDLNKKFREVHDKINKLVKQQCDFEGTFSNWARTIELQLAETSRVDINYEKKVQIYWQNIISQMKEGEFYLSRIQSFTEQKKRKLVSVPEMVTINLGNSLLKDIYNNLTVKFDELSIDKASDQILLTVSKLQQNGFKQRRSDPLSDKLSSLQLSQVNQLQNSITKKPIQVEFSSSQNFLSPVKDKMLSPASSSQIYAQNQRKSARQKSKSLPKPPHPNSMSNLHKNLFSPAKKQLTSTVSSFQITAQKGKQQTTIEGIVDAFVNDEKLDTLDLSYFQMTDQEIIATLNHVVSQKKIKCLKLCHNKLSNQGFSLILNSLRFTTNLNLSYNLLTEQILNALIKQRQKVGNLRILNISHNKVNERKAKVYVQELKKQGIIVTL